MKRQLLKHVRFLSILFWAALAVGPRACAQTPSGLGLQLYAGLSITGVVGTVYSVEYVTDLARTNDWHCLTFLQLPTTNYLWFDPTVAATAKRFYRSIQFDASTNLVFIPPGTFRMGSPIDEVDRGDDENPQPAVAISCGFWMGKYEVTQGEYLGVIGTNPSNFQGDTNRPVETVSWFDATNYCSRLTQREQAAGRIPAGSQFRLPTEAEWEYACRASTSTRFSYADDQGYAYLDSYAWSGAGATPGGTTHPVGQKLPNPWGLYDMHGNVQEWCQDWYDLYRPGIALNPQGPVTGSSKVSPSIGPSRVFRGGAWYYPEADTRSAFRFALPPEEKYSTIGFRVVLASAQP